ncbi:MAG: ribonuclease HII [Nanoarchaeota archaeon]
MYKVVGVDEAGKGPVIGSMFIGFCYAYLANGLKDLNNFQDTLKKDFGVKDSKLLSKKQRESIYLKLRDKLEIKYAQLTPALIDSNNFSGKNLNELEITAIVKVLEEIEPDLVIIDALTSNSENFAEQIKKKLSIDCKIISENKADTKYPIVSAASIVAKQLREQEIEEIKHNIKQDIGSGYPSDPKTKEFLKNNYNSKEYDFIFRKSWQTYKNIITNQNQKTLNDF